MLTLLFLTAMSFAQLGIGLAVGCPPCGDNWCSCIIYCEEYAPPPFMECVRSCNELYCGPQICEGTECIFGP